MKSAVLRAGEPSGEVTETITWDEVFSTKVRPSEVLSTDEVAQLFVGDYHSETVPEGWALRELG
ncbi:MAG TPA: hypothetical protein VMU39_26760 [Solirubrobacteraceae bacterium]|nr:hypothetical protein [Solirubrobacteraceae bacterium]